MSPHPLLLAHLRGEVPLVAQTPDGDCRRDDPAPRLVFPGSFNPLHAGHRELAAVAARRSGGAVHFELSVRNVDKPDLAADDVSRRLAQFVGYAPVWVTRAATFAEKVELFPGAAFVLGWDTAVRLIDPRYYAGDVGRRDEALRKLHDRGARIVVGGRVDRDGVFRVWEGADLDDEFRRLFDVIPEGEFRVDLSSTQMRDQTG